MLQSFILALSKAYAALPPAPEGDPSWHGGVAPTTSAAGASTLVELACPVHIPSHVTGDDPAVFDSFKTELVLFDHPQRGTIKLNFWRGSDPREIPHNHPWRDESDGPQAGVAFVSTILAGGYTEDVTRPDGSVESRTYRAGDENVSRYEDFHTVRDVLPGTITLMVCAPRVNVPAGVHPWGYTVDGEYVDQNHPAVADPTFFARFCLINPHRRPPAAWAGGLPKALRKD